jgi:transposase
VLTITNTTVSREDVWRVFRQTNDVRLRERYHCLLLLFDGHPCPDIARWLYRDDDTIRSWVAAFNEARLEGLKRAPIPGRPT